MPPGNFCFALGRKSLCYLNYIQKLGKPQHCFPPYCSFSELFNVRALYQILKQKKKEIPTSNTQKS